MSALLLAVALTAAPAASPDAGLDTPVLRALEAEVRRATRLLMPPTPGAPRSEPPYHVAAYVSETEVFDVVASMGALNSRSHNTGYGVSAQVRVGSPSFDNTNFSDRAFGEGRRLSPPAEPDPDVLRQTLWLTLDRTYKSALETLSRKRAFLETNQVAEKVPDFAPAPLASVAIPRPPLQVDRDAAARLVKSASAVFLDNPVIQDGSAWLRLRSSEQSFVSTDPVRHRFGEGEASIQLNVVGQAVDGMDLRLSHRFTGRTMADLPGETDVVAAAKALSGRMAELARAPLAEEDYTGPVLFVDQAAAMLFLQAVGDPLSSPREPLGSRTSGRMVERLGKRVAARFISVVDDPTLTEWNGQPLWGHYPVDDESVKPRRISLVESGVLKTYYMSRTPTAQVTASNGHCRGESAAPGTLMVSTAQPAQRAALKKRLLELARDEDLDFGLMVEVVEERVGRSNDAGRLSTPLVVWKVHADGRETLVRGLSFKPYGQRMLKEIDALGDDPFLLNLDHRGQKTSVVAPAVLVKLMELTRTRKDFEKPPFLARP